MGRRKTLAAALEEFLAAKKGLVSFHQYDGLRVRNTNFVHYCEKREIALLGDVTTEICDSWIKAKGQGLAARTRRGYLGDLSAFLNWCTKYPREWITRNPACSIERPRARQGLGLPSLLSVKTATAVMRHLEREHPRLVAFYALALFAGMRADKRDGEIKRLAEAIARDGWDRYINDRCVTVAQPKCGHARVFPLTDNLRAWLSCYPALQVPMQWQHTALAKRFELPSNAMRHTAISAYVTLHGSMAEAAVHFGNSESMIRRHYLNLMSREDAEAFYAIRPRGKLANHPGSS